MDKTEIIKEIYDMGFAVGVKTRPPQHIRDRFILMKMNYQEKALVEQLMKFLSTNQCPIPEFFAIENKKEFSEKMIVYLMGIHNGSIYEK